MRISDWSSDVCSSDLLRTFDAEVVRPGGVALLEGGGTGDGAAGDVVGKADGFGHASPQTTENPSRKGSSWSIQMVLRPVAMAEPSIDGMIAGWSPIRISSSIRPMKRSEEHTSELQS